MLKAEGRVYGYAVTSMSIRSVALNETCLGGSLENIKKE